VSGIGERIKQIRQENGLKQLQLAKLVHVEPSYISQLESNKRHPSFRLITAIAEACQVNVKWLRNGEGEKEVAEPQPPTSKSPRRDAISDSRIPKAGPGGDRAAPAPEWRPRPEDPLTDTVRKLVDELTEQLRINRGLQEENENLRRRLHQVEGVVAGDHPPPTGERRRCVFEITDLLTKPGKGNSG